MGAIVGTMLLIVLLVPAVQAYGQVGVQDTVTIDNKTLTVIIDPPTNEITVHVNNTGLKEMVSEIVEEKREYANGELILASATMLSFLSVGMFLFIRRGRSFRSPYQDLQHICLAPEGKTQPGDPAVPKPGCRASVFPNRTLGPDAHDSAINGGKIQLTREGLRAALAEIYSTVRMHNHHVLHAHRMIDWTRPGEISEAAFHYGMLESPVHVLLMGIPKMMQTLKELEPSLRTWTLIQSAPLPA